MGILLSRLADDFADELHNSKFKYLKSCLKYIKVKEKLTTFKCLKFNKIYKRYFNKDIVKWLANTYKFSDGIINKFCLTLGKEVYPYE